MREISDAYLLSTYDVELYLKPEYKTMLHSLRIHTKTCLSFLRREFYLPDTMGLYVGIMVTKPTYSAAAGHTIVSGDNTHYIYYSLANLVLDYNEFFNGTVQHETCHAITYEIDSEEHIRDGHGQLWREVMQFLWGSVHEKHPLKGRVEEFKQIRYDTATEFAKIYKERSSK